MRPDEGGRLHVACVPEKAVLCACEWRQSEAWQFHSSECVRTTLGMNFVISVGAKVAGWGLWKDG